jgi:cell division protein FtsZ
MAGLMRVSVVATGIDAAARSEAMPMPKRPGAEAVAVPAASAAQAARPQGEIVPAVETSRSPNFADHQVAEEERAELFAEPQAVVPQPSALERTAPFGQPKFDGDRRAGEPSPDALRRLQAAVQNVPKAQPMVRSVGEAPAREPERHGRLTINSLIHKMTGQVGREQSAPRKAAEPEPGPFSEAAYDDNERERVDIPAFLRRQAN